jgi:GNAT superfamily N-acetyltransferase
MDITIRSATTGDIPRMVELLGDLFSIESDFAPDKESQARGLAMLVNEPSGMSQALVAVHDGTAVGMTTVQMLISTSEGGCVGLVEDVIIDRQFRGRGIGTLLLEHIAEWGKSRNLKRLQLLADRKNDDALAFYAKRGWSSTSLICLRKISEPL